VHENESPDWGFWSLVTALVQMALDLVT